MSSTPPRKTLGRYEVLDTLGQGGMGVVYLANDPVLGRKVAVKTILASNFATEDQDELLRRLLKEGQAAANMRHPGIVTVFDAMQQGDETYIVMEYVAGRKLSDLLKERPNHDIALRILREIAEALDYAHETGIVHRDIKPDNILLDNNDKVRIADFGIAKSLSRHSITPGAVGTPHYMSPEQIRNEDEIDGKADQFSLGVIAYLMLTGKKPFDGKSQLAIGQKIVGEDPPPASRVEKSLPPEVDAVLLKSLAKNPKQRYATCMAFIEELERAVEGSSPAGGKTGGGMTRWLVAAAILLVLAAAGFAAWQYRGPIMALIGPKAAYALRVENGTAGPLQPGQQFTSGDPSAPSAGALSATVTADQSIPSSAVVELALLENGQVVDRAELHGGTAPLKYAFKAPINQAAYTVRLTVDGVKEKDLQFSIVAPVVQFGLEIRVMGTLATEGQKFNKKDPEYPAPHTIGPDGVTATVVSTPDHADPGNVFKLEWLKNGQSFSLVDLKADDAGKPLTMPTGPKGPDIGDYTVKLTAGGAEKTVSFSIVGAGTGPQPGPGPGPGLQPGPGPGPGPHPPPPPPKKKKLPVVWTMSVFSMDCTLRNGQSFMRDDEKCGGIFRPQDVNLEIRPDRPENVDPAGTVELQWKKKPPTAGESDPFRDLGPRIPVAAATFGQKISAPVAITRGSYSIHLIVDGDDVKSFNFEVK